jgi:hypothetical protein
VTCAIRESSPYTCPTILESIQTIDSTTRPVVDKGIVTCTNSVIMIKMLYVFFFPVNKISHVTTEEQAVDYLTKRLSSLDLAIFCDHMDLIDIF